MTKRWRMLWALLTQRWVEQSCTTCGVRWYASAHHPGLGVTRLCLDCETKEFEAWMRLYQTRLQAEPKETE